MKTNLADFKRMLNVQAKKTVDTLIKDTQIAVGRYVYEGVCLRSPVLTGKFRHNWQCAVNKEPEIERDAVFGGTTTGEPITANERAMFTDAANQLKKQPVGQTLYIVNNLPYAQRLENGWSQKAPTGMVEITLMEVLEGVSVSQPKVLTDDGGE